MYMCVYLHAYMYMNVTHKTLKYKNQNFKVRIAMCLLLITLHNLFLWETVKCRSSDKIYLLFGVI